MQENKKQKTAWLADGLCLVVAAIWGSGFIASQMAIDAHMSAALIMAVRFLIAAVVMLAACIPKLRGFRHQEIVVGARAGVFLFAGFYTQIVGQQNTTVSHCAFLTATNVVMVPFIVWLFSRRRPPTSTFLLAGTTLLGIGVLSITPGSFSFSFNFGDAMTLLCALMFALHITSLGSIGKEADVMRVNLVQLTVAALISLAVFLLTDLDSVSVVNWHTGLPAVLFLGLFSTCLCYFLQTLAQKHTTPSKAGVLLSTEGLFGSLLSVMFGYEKMTVQLVIGGMIILCSIIVMELFTGKKPE